MGCTIHSSLPTPSLPSLIIAIDLYLLRFTCCETDRRMKQVLQDQVLQDQVLQDQVLQDQNTLVP
jgi:hypothetical protein